MIFDYATQDYENPFDNIISTTAGGVNTIVNSINTNLDRYSTSLISILSTNSAAEIYTSTLFTSSIILSGTKQPFIQYGSGTITPNLRVTIPKPYANTNYVIQLTYSNGTQPTQPIFTSNITTANFYVSGGLSANFYWTTIGNIL